MSSHTNVATLVAAAKPADLVELEAQFEEAQASLNAVHRKLSVEQENASAAYSTPFKIKNDLTMAATAAKVETLIVTKSAIEKTLRDLRQKIESARPAAIAAIRAALAPHRQQAANDIVVATKTLYGAIGRFNETSEALDPNGDRAPALPASIPVLDLIVNQVAKG